MRRLVALFFAVPTLGLAQGNDNLAEWVRACAPKVHPMTMGSIVAVESAGNIFAVGDDGDLRLPYSQRVLRSFRPQSRDEAIRIAKDLLSKGHGVGLGPSQISSGNLRRLKMTVEDAFDTCRNLAAGQTVLTAFYTDAARQFGEGAVALRHALSAYNTGNFWAGIKNGYVDKVLAAARRPLPPLRVLPPRKDAGRGWVVAQGRREHGVIGSRMTTKQARMADLDVGGEWGRVATVTTSSSEQSVQ